MMFLMFEKKNLVSASHVTEVTKHFTLENSLTFIFLHRRQRRIMLLLIIIPAQKYADLHRLQIYAL